MEFCSTDNLNTSSTIVENLSLFAKIVATLFWTYCSFVTLDLDRLLNREFVVVMATAYMSVTS